MDADISTGNDGSRTQVQNALATSEARMHALLEAAVDGIISIDAQGVIQTINPAVERMFGYVEDEVIGQNVKMLTPSPYREEHDSYLAHYLATGQKKIIGIGREVIGLRKDGTTFPMDLSVAEARVGAERIFLGIVRDITERKRAEEERASLAAIVESSEDAIISKKLDGIIVSWNGGAERLYGYTAEEVVGKPLSILAPPDRADEMPGIIERLRRGERISHYETVRLRKDGRRVDVSLTISAVKNEDGQIIGASKIARDITERKQAEKDLHESKENLERTVAELQAKNEEIRTMTQQLWQAAKLASVGELAASIAHELNNPLATVSLRVESTLQRTPADDPRRRGLEIIEQETKRMGDLVANLLQFSRRGEEKISTVDIREELTRAVELIQHHLRKQQVTVAQELAPDTPTLFADRQKLRQVFLTLLTNAGDAMPQGGTLTLRSAPASLENGKPAVLIEFVDTGVGVPAEHLEKIMEPFFTTKEEGKGAGTGDLPPRGPGTPRDHPDCQRGGQRHHRAHTVARPERHQRGPAPMRGAG
jgi:two-component system, LuxR family, sensor kinase FixL